MIFILQMRELEAPKDKGLAGLLWSRDLSAGSVASSPVGPTVGRLALVPL